MERQRLIKLIENKGTSSKEETTELWDIVRSFPYFQTARLLLAKSFHNQGSIHFHNELKVAAAYAADRKVLFRLINNEVATQKTEALKKDSDTKAPDSIATSNVFALEQNQTIETAAEKQFNLTEERRKPQDTPVFELKENTQEVPLPEIEFGKTNIEEKIATPAKAIPDNQPANTMHDEPSTTQEDIIRKRLSEILAKNKPEQQAAPPTPQNVVTIVDDTTEFIPPLTDRRTLDELPSQPADIIEGLEIETIIEENYLQELEKLPEIIPPTHQGEDDALNKVSEITLIEEEKIDPSYSFINWLKHKNDGHTTVEEVKDEPLSADRDQKKEFTSPDLKDKVALIDKFITDKPRIAPVKAEFYSPSNMARLSITDNEDIISETLARIYFEQGNYSKALSCYQRLALLFPEKSASFAPLIEKINKLITET